MILIQNGRLIVNMSCMLLKYCNWLKRLGTQNMFLHREPKLSFCIIYCILTKPELWLPAVRVHGKESGVVSKTLRLKSIKNFFSVSFLDVNSVSGMGNRK